MSLGFPGICYNAATHHHHQQTPKGTSVGTGQTRDSVSLRIQVFDALFYLYECLSPVAIVVDQIKLCDEKEGDEMLPLDNT